MMAGTTNESTYYTQFIMMAAGVLMLCADRPMHAERIRIYYRVTLAVGPVTRTVGAVPEMSSGSIFVVANRMWTERFLPH